jgi:small conductance mechanosensitive channel
MNALIQSLSNHGQQILGILPRLLLAILALLLFYILGKYLARLLKVVLRRTPLRKLHESFFSTLTVMASMFFGLIVALNILGLERVAVSVLAGGGVTAVVLGFAFREIGENFLAGIFLAFSSPFKTGDLIRTEDIEGKVVSVELRNTHLRTEDGKDVFVPSSQLFNRPVTNYTRDGMRRLSFTVGIDYANDAKAACKLLKTTTTGVAGVMEKPEASAFIQELDVDFVQIKVCFWIDTFAKTSGEFPIRTEVMDRCRIALLETGYTVSAETTTNVAVITRENGRGDPTQS